MRPTPSTYPCPGTLRKSFKSTSIACPLPHSIVRRRNQGNPTGHRQHPLLYPSSGHHCPHGPQLDCDRTIEGDHEHDGKGQTITRISRHSPLIMNVHSDASYLSESDARSRACGHFFMGWSPQDGDPIRLNGAFFTLCAIICFVVASAVEAELGALFLNCKIGDYRQRQTDLNTARENNSHVDYDYNDGGKVLVPKDGILRKTESRYGSEPWTITSVHTNGTIRVECRSKSERLNIRRVTPIF
jgi:hypothetical protein